MGRTKTEKESPRTWTPAEKLRVVATADGLSDADLGSSLRHERINEQELVEEGEADTAVLSTGKPKKTKAEPRGSEDKKASGRAPAPHVRSPRSTAPGALCGARKMQP